MNECPFRFDPLKLSGLLVIRNFITIFESARNDFIHSTPGLQTLLRVIAIFIVLIWPNKPSRLSDKIGSRRFTFFTWIYTSHRTCLLYYFLELFVFPIFSVEEFWGNLLDFKKFFKKFAVKNWKISMDIFIFLKICQIDCLLCSL